MNQIVNIEYLHQQGLSNLSNTFLDRFWKYINKNGPIPEHFPELGPCWEWMGYKRPGKWNYGMICVGIIARNILVHRVSWIIHNGAIPPGQFVLHACDYCPCLNPDHLFLGSPKDNTRDMMSKKRWICGNHSGEHNGRATITWKIVTQIRDAYIPWKVTRSELAKRFGVSKHVVKAIVNNKTWINSCPR